MTEPWAHSGWMSKKGHLNPLWANRFFVLSGNTLTYFKDETTVESKRDVTADRVPSHLSRMPRRARARAALRPRGPSRLSKRRSSQTRTLPLEASGESRTTGESAWARCLMQHARGFDRRWMITEAAGKEYPLRCFAHKERDTWVAKITTLPCVMQGYTLAVPWRGRTASCTAERLSAHV